MIQAHSGVVQFFMFMQRPGAQSGPLPAGPVSRARWLNDDGALHLPTTTANRARMPEAKPENGPLDVARLIEAVARRDRVAFASLFTLFAPRLKSMLMRNGLDAVTAEDIAQDCMLIVWRKASAFDPAGASASGWIYTIARNLRIDALRRHQRGQRTATGLQQEPLPAQKSQTDLLDDFESQVRVRSALKSLSPDHLRVVTLSFFEDRPHPEIAEALGIPLGTVKSRLRLAMKRLRDLLDDTT